MFQIINDTLYEADYVVSTLNESGSTEPLSQTSESSATSSRQPINPRKRPRQDVDIASERPVTPCTLDRPTSTATPVVAEMNSGINESGFRLTQNSAGYSVQSQCVNSVDVSSNINETLPIVKSVFGRCFNATFQKQNLPGHSKVLVYDSDGMEDSD